MVSLDEINAQINNGEGVGLEFKESYSDRIGETICAFANGYGNNTKGTILLGINDSGNLVGVVGDVDLLQRKILDVAHKCTPQITPFISVVQMVDKKIIHISIPRGGSRPYHLNGRCYIRVGSSTRTATPEEEEHIRQEANLTPYDSTCVEGTSASDLNQNKIQEFYAITRSDETVKVEDRDALTLAEALGFLKRENNVPRPTVSAILLFGKDPQKILKHSSINAIRFRGYDQSDQIMDRKEITGTVPMMIDEAAKFVNRFSIVESKISNDSVYRIDKQEYPFVPVREALANAVAHRDYTNIGIQVDLYMFDDRIEITSPGGLGGGITKDDLENATGNRWTRNPTLASLLYEMGIVERAGTGIKRMFKEMKSNGSNPPSFIITNSRVKVILKAHPDYVARRHFEDASFAKDRGELETAKKHLVEALNIKPDYSDAKALMAALEGQLGSIESARNLYKSILKNNPKDFNAILNWALLEDKNGDYDQARKLYHETLVLQPTNTYAINSYALLERRLGNLPRARVLFKELTQINPDNPINWQIQGQLEVKAKNFKEALKLFEKALELSNDDHNRAWIHADIAFTMQSLKMPINEIEEHYKLSLSLNPTNPKVNAEYGFFLVKTGRQWDGDKYIKKAKLLGWKKSNSSNRR